MYLVDANIFLEVLLSRARKEECKKFLRSLRDGKKSGIVTDFTIHSIIVIMSGLNRLNELKTFLLSLLAYKGLHVHYTTLTDEVKATELAIEQNLDMDDAIQYSSALSANAEAIISFDKHFNGLKIPRKEPQPNN
ncbi:type II toxin-antitoxin system VapC family toxin [Candidatus Bathyarchaeota archaeon]|nr:type II toxin-antitoxin system VapC family toxin [Candidatus Bathyarchaeota archaeon]